MVSLNILNLAFNDENKDHSSVHFPEMGLASVCWILLGAGAVLSVVGGVGACAYNGRAYDRLKGYKRQFEGSFKKPLDCALSAAIIGVFRAIVSIAALALLIVGLPKLIVAILFIVSAVLYLGELIPEAIFLDAVKYGLEGSSIKLLPAEKHECSPTGTAKLVEWITTYEQWTASIPRESQEIWQRIKYLLQGAYGYETGYCWNWNDAGRWQAMYVEGSCLLDFTKTEFPDMVTDSDCDKIKVGVTECVGGWSASSVLSEVKKACKKQYQEMKEQEEMAQKWGTDVKGYANAMMEKEAKMSMTGQIEYYPSTWYVANSIILGVQTVAFIATIVGVILHFISGGKDVTEEP